eukprot:1966365-Pleurochrysis_carterae.AAC.2
MSKKHAAKTEGNRRTRRAHAEATRCDGWKRKPSKRACNLKRSVEHKSSATSLRQKLDTISADGRVSASTAVTTARQPSAERAIGGRCNESTRATRASSEPTITDHPSEKQPTRIDSHAQRLGPSALDPATQHEAVNVFMREEVRRSPSITPGGHS